MQSIRHVFFVAGACVDLSDRDHMSALCWACLRGHLPCAQTLIEYGANIEHVDRNGRSPLDLATLHGDARLVSATSEAAWKLVLFVDVASFLRDVSGSRARTV